MAIAIANANPPLFLFLDYLLASSWTWFAVLLATIATTLRALRLRFPRAEASPAVAIPDASCVQPSSGASISLRKSFKRRAGSKSTSSLEKLSERNRGRFWRSGIELLSSVLVAELPSNLKRIASASKIVHGQHAHMEMHQRRGLHATHAILGDVSAEKVGVGTAKQRSDSCEASGFETPLKENEQSCQSSSMDDGMCTEDCASSCPWLPSWAFSLCGPSQLRWSSINHHVSPPCMVPPCFEKQFGWDKLLNSKLGLSWSSPSGAVSGVKWQNECTTRNDNVVKVWDDLPKKLLRKLNLDEGTTLAIDVSAQNGRACTGAISGEISMWDFEHSARMSASASFGQPVSALSMNLEQCATVVGSATSIGLWDRRSPSCNLHFASMPSASVSGLKSRENGLCVAAADGILSMYDLRKLKSGPLVSEPAPKRHERFPVHHDEAAFWEKIACDSEDEDEDEVECDVAREVGAAESRKGGSIASRWTMFVRAVTFML